MTPKLHEIIVSAALVLRDGQKAREEPGKERGADEDMEAFQGSWRAEAAEILPELAKVCKRRWPGDLAVSRSVLQLRRRRKDWAWRNAEDASNSSPSARYRKDWVGTAAD